MAAETKRIEHMNCWALVDVDANDYYIGEVFEGDLAIGATVMQDGVQFRVIGIDDSNKIARVKRK